MNYALEIVDINTLYVSLEGISYALKKGLALPPVNGDNPFVLAVENSGLLDKIEELQNHSNKKIYDKCMWILSTYFENEEDDHLPLVDEATISDQGPSYNDLFNV